MKYSIANHPQFSEKWSDYADKFNHLSETMQKAGLDVKLLNDVVTAIQAVEELASDVAFRSGCEKRSESMTKGNVIEMAGQASGVLEEENKVDHVYLSLSETTFRYQLLSEISLILFSLHADDVYTKEHAMEDLMKVIKTIQLDMPILPIGEVKPSEAC